MAESTRVCVKCGTRRPLNGGFYKRTNRRGETYYTRDCRQCFREYLSARKKPCADYVRTFKVSRGCMDCGLKIDRPEVYDLDHRPGESKVEKVSELVNRGDLQAVVAECAKCDVVCANCHRIRTVDRVEQGVGFTSAFWDLRKVAATPETKEPTLFNLPD